MSQFLRQSTAYTFRLGPFVDSADGNTQENSLTIAYTDVFLSKAGGALSAKNETTNLTGTGANAHYTCILNTTDTNTLGGLRVWCHISASALPVWQDFIVIPATAYDSMVAATSSYITLADLKAQAENAITAYAPLKTSVSGRLIDVSAGGEAGIDWANIGSPTTVVGLTNTTISGVLSMAPPGPTVDDIWTRPTRSITDKAGFSLLADQSGVTIGAVTGAVGSVTGNVGGNVVGSVGAIGTNALDNAAIHSNACAKIADSGIQRGASFWENNLDNRSLGWAISKLVNKVDLNAAGDTLSIRKSNDSTALFTQTVSTSGGAAPITAVDTV